MKTFKEMTEQEIKEFTTSKEKFVEEYKSMYKINNVLLIGIGTYCNTAISKVDKQDNISKLYVDTNKKLLEQYSNYPILDLSEENISKTDSLWKEEDKYQKLYKEVSKYQVYFINYDYIVICTTTDSEEYNLIAEVIADFCNEQNKRFMLCYPKYTFMSYAANIAGLKTFKYISNNFVSKVKSKSYILNEINCINTSLLYDITSFKFQGGDYKLNIETQSNSKEYDDINSDIFARILECNIIKMLGE